MRDKILSGFFLRDWQTSLQSQKILLRHPILPDHGRFPRVLPVVGF
jgi:hypothetical protein